MKNAILTTMICNREFADKAITKNSVSAEDFAILNVKISNLLNVAYSAFVAQHDSATASELSPVFTGFKDMLTLVNTDDDCKVRCDVNTARTITAMAVTFKNSKSQELQDAETELRERRQVLSKLEDINGVQESALENARSLVEAQEKVVAEIKTHANAVTKEPVKATLKDFSKRVEDYIADLALGNFMKSNATIEAESEAKKRARAEKQRAKRAEKKAQEKAKKASAQDASTQAQVNA